MAPSRRKKTAPTAAPRSKAATRTPRARDTIHELKITLDDVDPPIWRTFAVRSDISLADLHDIIQVVMGWGNEHLYQFMTRDRKYYLPQDPDGGGGWDEGEGDTYDVRVHEVLRVKRSKLTYEYDFGDSWKHIIEVTAIHPPKPRVKYPRCLAGARACPPEDCGGTYGYMEILADLADPENAEDSERLDWLGGEFDADAFSVNKVNRRLAAFR